MLTYSMENRGEASLYEYLYRCIRSDIESGSIAPDEKLPSKRALADHLGVSVITVEGAYTQLLAEGYVRAEPRRGYYACAVFAGANAGVHAGKARTAKPKATVPTAVSCDSLSAQPLVADLSGGAAPQGLFPYSVWARAVRDALSWETEGTLVDECTGVGSPRLRNAIADHLLAFRGMEVDPECIVVGAGSQVLDSLIIQLLGRDRVYAVEDPGYPRLTKLYHANGAQLVHVPLDADGVSVSALNASGASVMHLMPSHQYPTGLVTSISRRYELLGWAAQEEGRYLIEDDYDCEFRLAGKPIPSLQSIDTTGSVIYTNTFTKSLGSAFRIAYMVLPSELMQRYQQQLGFYSATVSAIDQLALARFIAKGDYERNINRMRTHYRDVRDALIGALRGSAFKDRISISAQDSGLHFVLKIEGIDSLPQEQEFCNRAAKRGIRISPLSAYCVSREAAERFVGSFLIAYSGIQNDAIPAVVKALEGALER